MSALGSLLDLPEESRVSNVVLQPIVRDAAGARLAGLAVHRISYEGEVVAQEVTLALAAFLPSALTVLSGELFDGGSWGAVIQAIPASPDVRGEPSEDETAAAWSTSLVTMSQAFNRARRLIGVRGDVRAASLGAADMRSLWIDDGALVTDWSDVALAVGLVVEAVTNNSLSDLAAPDAGRPHGDDECDEQIRTLERRLHTWATTYDGPES